MTTNKPACASVLRRDALREDQYALSLLAEGVKQGLTEAETMRRIQRECMALLGEQARKWGGGGHSSLRAERAEEMLASILYVVGLALKAAPTPEEALSTLCRTPVSTLFEQGMRCVQRILQRARLLHCQLSAHLFPTPNVFYRATVVNGIGGFFRLYRPEFAAQERHITADYPTWRGEGRLTGVSFILRYLQNIAYENQFCLHFSPQTVDKLLGGADAAYRQTPVNLYGYVLPAALSCVLTGRPPRTLCCDAERLYSLLSGKEETAIQAMLAHALDALGEMLKLSPGTKAYAADALPRLSAILRRAVLLRALDAVVPRPACPDSFCQTSLDYGERMPDLAYQRRLEAIERAETPDQRARLLAGQDVGLGDLIELLHDARPTEHELAILLTMLPQEAVDALRMHYAQADFLTDAQDRLLYEALHQLP